MLMSTERGVRKFGSNRYPLGCRPCLTKDPIKLGLGVVKLNGELARYRCKKSRISLATVPIATGPPLAVPQKLGSGSVPPGMGTYSGCPGPAQALGVCRKTLPTGVRASESDVAIATRTFS